MQLINKQGLLWLHPNYRNAMRSTAAVLLLLAFIQLLAWLILASSGAKGIPNYLSLHTLLETISIVVAMMVFAVGWNSRSGNLSGNIVLLAGVFFAVGALDFLHTVSYGGMPDFISPNDPQKHLNFWLSARFFSAIVLLAVAIRPWKPLRSRASRYVIFASLISAVALINWVVLYHQAWLPDTFISGQGLTAFKKNSEYLIIVFNIVTAIILWHKMREPQTFNVVLLFGAVCTLVMSEFFFTLYTTMTGSYNVLGHIYKVIAYLFIYRAIVVETIEEPFNKLALAQQNLGTALRASNTGLWNWDLHTNVVLYSPEWKAQLGYLPGELPDQFSTWESLLHPDDLASAMERVQSFLSSSQQHYENEFRMHHRDGSYRWIVARGEKQYDANDNATRLIGSHIEITERKEKEAEILRLSRAYQLLSRVNEAIVRTHDRDELFSTICRAAVESGLFRLAWMAALDGTEVKPIVHAGFEEGYLDKLHIRLDDERTGQGPTATVLRNGIHAICQDIENDPSMLPWRDEALQRGYRSTGQFPIREAGAVVGTINTYAGEINFFTPDIVQLMLELTADVSFALDVFAGKKLRKQAEGELKQLNLELESRVQERTHQLEVANQELEAFSYSVSHDLRAPLRSIDGFSQILSKKYHDSLDDMGRDYLERVRRASQRMGHLIDDLLQLSKVTRNSLKREHTDLSEIAENVVKELRKTNPARQVHFVLEPGLSVYADTGLLRVVMDNLMGNAYKFTGKKADAEIELGVRDIDGERTFFVRDNGAGFNMGYAHKLFGAFQRLHGSNEFEGTGIGLATVQRIIHRHNGRVWAEAKEGLGATFYFTMPQRMRET